MNFFATKIALLRGQISQPQRVCAQECRSSHVSAAEAVQDGLGELFGGCLTAQIASQNLVRVIAQILPADMLQHQPSPLRNTQAVVGDCPYL